MKIIFECVPKEKKKLIKIVSMYTESVNTLIIHIKYK